MVREAIREGFTKKYLRLKAQSNCEDPEVTGNMLSNLHNEVKVDIFVLLKRTNVLKMCYSTVLFLSEVQSFISETY